MGERITEKPSNYRHLEKMSVQELLVNINIEDQVVPSAVEKAIPQIEKLVEAASDKMLMGGRLFYIGAGTSGRLGIVDASECPPTYGVPYGLVIGIIAGGEKAITTADLGLNPASDGNVIRVPVPALTEERRREFVKTLHKLAEEGRVAIRHARQEANKELKKKQGAHEISEDDARRHMDEVQKMTDNYIHKVDELLKSKEQEVMEV